MDARHGLLLLLLLLLQGWRRAAPSHRWGRGRVARRGRMAVAHAVAVAAIGSAVSAVVSEVVSAVVSAAAGLRPGREPFVCGVAPIAIAAVGAIVCPPPS